MMTMLSFAPSTIDTIRIRKAVSKQALLNE